MRRVVASRLARLLTGSMPVAALLLALSLSPCAALGETLATDLTSHLIAITSGFSGDSVVLFGATDGPGDIVVNVRGPGRAMTVRRKSRILGVWINTEAVTFVDVPEFYFVAASRPLDEIVSPATAARYRLGVGNLPLATEMPAPPTEVDMFAAALVRGQREAGLFSEEVGKVAFLGERLFRTTIAFPSNVPTGVYNVDVLLIRDRKVVATQTTPLTISKAGLAAAVVAFASRRPGLYGAIAVLVAVVAGWLASLPFRRA